MRKIRFPDLDITGMWVLAVGVFFHLIARLVRKQPELAIQAGEIFGLGMVVFGGYRILNALIAEAERRRRPKNSLKNTTKTAATVTLLLALSGMAQAGTLDEVRSLQRRVSPALYLPPGRMAPARGDAGFSAPLVPAQQRQAGGPAGLKVVLFAEVPVLP
jgi:type-F conjugative transfer system pilin chaperone TraQ